MPNSLFIDTSNLNVLFKVNGKFVLGVNYASCPDKIAIDAQALGTPFDVYLSMWPRQAGESDDIVNALSVGGVPFVVLRDEVEAALHLVDKIPGVGDIFLCNALANFVIQARVSNFQSVINYGSRVALVDVKNKLLEGLTIYDNADALYEAHGDDLSCYGDLDLIDVDAIKAQYEELTSYAKNIIVPLAHLVTSYRSPYNAEMDVVKRELSLGEYASAPKPVEKPKAKPAEPPKKVTPKPYVKDPSPKDNWEDEVNYKKPGVSLVNVFLILVIFAGCAITGLGFAFRDVPAQISQLQAEVAPFNTEAQRYNEITKVYTSCNGVAEYASNLLSYAQANTAGFNIAGLEVGLDSIVIRCNSANPDAIGSFRDYLESQYIVGEVNNLDEIAGANNTVIYNYNVTVVRQ